MRGLRTVLVEQHDLGWGTSSRSSRLVHGGLRYLETGDLRLVLEANRERRVLLRIAPHLVWPLPFVFPLHRGDRVGPARLAAGMWLYDLLALFRNVKGHRMLGKRALLEAEPMLRERGLRGGALFYDAQCDDARLTLATARWLPTMSPWSAWNGPPAGWSGRRWRTALAADEASSGPAW